MESLLEPRRWGLNDFLSTPWPLPFSVAMPAFSVRESIISYTLCLAPLGPRAPPPLGMGPTRSLSDRPTGGAMVRSPSVVNVGVAVVVVAVTITIILITRIMVLDIIIPTTRRIIKQ